MHSSLTFGMMTFFVSHYYDTLTYVVRVILYESRETFCFRDNRKKNNNNTLDNPLDLYK